jgi:hypothetical protein
MGFESERAAIEGKMSEFTTAPIAYDNAPFEADNNEPWVRLTILNGASSYRTLNGDTKHNGLIDISVFVPKNEGSKEARTIIDELDTLFRLQSLDSGSIKVAAGSVTTLGVTGAWKQYNISFPFRRVENDGI